MQPLVLHTFWLPVAAAMAEPSQRQLVKSLVAVAICLASNKISLKCLLIYRWGWISFFMAQTPLVVQDLLTVEVLWSHSGTPHLVGIFRTSDQPEVKNSTKQHSTLKRDFHVSSGIRNGNPNKRAAASPRLRPHGHCDRLGAEDSRKL